MTSARAPGNIIDWVYKKTGVKYSFAAHLRDTGTVSFSVRPMFRENWLSFFFSHSLQVWFCAPGTMDTACWRRNSKDDRILGRLYHWEGVSLKPVKKKEEVCMTHARLYDYSSLLRPVHP